MYYLCNYIFVLLFQLNAYKLPSFSESINLYIIIIYYYYNKKNSYEYENILMIIVNILQNY